MEYQCSDEKLDVYYGTCRKSVAVKIIFKLYWDKPVLLIL